MKIDDQEHVTSAEAARMIAAVSGSSMSEGRVRQLVGQGVIQARKLGNTNWIPVDNVMEYARHRPKAGWPKGRPRKSGGD